MGRVLDDLKNEEVIATRKVYDDAVGGIDTAIGKYRARNAQITSALAKRPQPENADELAAERKENKGRLKKLLREKGDVERDRIDFEGSILAIDPPDPDISKEIAEKLARIDELIKQDAVTAALFDVAMELADIAQSFG